MRLFGTFKFIEAYLIISAILLLYSFHKLCKQEEIPDLHAHVHPEGLQAVVPIQVILLNISNVQNETTDKESDIHAIDLSTDKDKLRGPPMVTNTSEHLILAVSTPQPEVTLAGTDDVNLVVNSKTNATAGGVVNGTLLAKPSGVTTLQPSLEVTNGTFLVVAPMANATDAIKAPVPTPSTLQPEVSLEGTYDDGVRAFNLSQDQEIREEPLVRTSQDSRKRRHLLHGTEMARPPVVEDQTVVGVFRCEHVLPFSFEKWWNDSNVYQSMFTIRIFAMVMLFIHFLIIVCHSIGNVSHRVPTSQRINRILAVVGIAIWGIIDAWIVYRYLTWDAKFAYAPFVPNFPEELITFAILSISMVALLVYEFITPMTIYTSYDVEPRHPRMGYTPAARSENEYISGIITQLEASQMNEQYPIGHSGFNSFKA